MNVTILDAHGQPIRSQASAYRAASSTAQEMMAWRPPLTSADAAILESRELATARAEDLARNDPHAVAGVTRLVDMLVGAGLRLSAKPDARALKLDPTKKTHRKKLRDLATAMETEWRCYAEDPMKRCDAQRRLSQNGIWRLAARSWVRKGETTAFLAWKPTPTGRYKTCIRVIDPDRVCNPNNAMDTATLRGGIEFDTDGVPLAYHVRNNHPADFFMFSGSPRWERIPRATDWGRPVFIHGFEPDREDQSRAITPFAALMARMRLIGKFADTELASATVNALFAAFVSSNLPVEAATQAFTATQATFADKRTDYWLANPPTFGGVRIPVLPIGDEVKVNASPRQTTAFPAFQAAFLQSIASALGISYEQLSMDWSKVNYSSARAALNEVWRHIQTVFAAFVEQVVAPVHFAVMEEAFAFGHIAAPKGAPDFHDAPAAYLRARWIGPGRGYVDPVKEAEGASLRMGAMISTLEREAGEQGLDFEETLDQIAIEEEMLRERGLKRAEPAKRKAGAPEAEETRQEH